MNAELNTITINGKEYVEKGSIATNAVKLDGHGIQDRPNKISRCVCRIRSRTV
jgi:hypothetical protein